MRRILIGLGAFFLLADGMAHAQTALLAGRRARILDRPGTSADGAQIVFAKDPALALPPNPLCPATTVLRIETSSGSTGDISLPCTGWKLAGSGFRYREPTGIAGGITSVLLRPGTLNVVARGARFPSVGLPGAHVQVSLAIGGAGYCGRFTLPKRLTATRSEFVGPTSACPGPPPTPTPTPAPPPLSNVSVVDQSDGDILNEYKALGNCYRGRKHHVGLTRNDGSQLAVRYAQSVAADCETTFGDYEIGMSSGYRVGFDVNCPFGRPYVLVVSTQLRGAHTVQHDSGDGCNAAIPGSATAYVSGVTGSHVGGVLTAGSLHLAEPPLLDTGDTNDWGFWQGSSAEIRGTGTGTPVRHELAFSWGASCRSYGGAFHSGDECGVRLGLSSEIAPNGIFACSDADDYPGYGGRDPNADGHVVNVAAYCQ